MADVRRFDWLVSSGTADLHDDRARLALLGKVVPPASESPGTFEGHRLLRQHFTRLGPNFVNLRSSGDADAHNTCCRFAPLSHLVPLPGHAGAVGVSAA